MYAREVYDETYGHANIYTLRATLFILLDRLAGRDVRTASKPVWVRAVVEYCPRPSHLFVPDASTYLIRFTLPAYSQLLSRVVRKVTLRIVRKGVVLLVNIGVNPLIDAGIVAVAWNARDRELKDEMTTT